MLLLTTIPPPRDGRLRTALETGQQEAFKGLELTLRKGLWGFEGGPSETMKLWGNHLGSPVHEAPQ